MGFNENLREKLRGINIDIGDEELGKFYEYMNLLIEWNKKINLTAITEENDVILKHFVDSLTVLKYIKGEERIIDVGTGAGFPGIPLKIMNSHVEITLVDSLNKRVVFLNDVIDKLNLKNIKAIHGRVEEVSRNRDYRESYDVVVSRAVANMSTLSEYMLPFAKVGGRCICMKGANIQEELQDSKKAIRELGGEIEVIDNFKLPESEYERNNIVISKVLHTKDKYPRKAGIPSKDPIK